MYSSGLKSWDTPDNPGTRLVQAVESHLSLLVETKGSVQLEEGGSEDFYPRLYSTKNDTAQPPWLYHGKPK